MNDAFTRRAALIACLALALAACGKKESAPATTEAPEASAAAAVTACDLVTQEEGAGALGEAVNDPVEQIISAGGPEMAAMSMCTVQATASPGRTIFVSFRRSPVDDNQPESVRQTLTESGVTAEDVSGVGDAAFWGASELHVFVAGNTYFTVGVRGLDDGPGALARATEIANRALEKLGE